MHREIASDRYVGGAVVPDLGSIHPGLYHEGLVRRAREAGARLFPFTAVERIEPSEGPKQITTSRGALMAQRGGGRDQWIHEPHLRWHARRVIPFRGFIIATEKLPDGLIERVLPQSTNLSRHPDEHRLHPPGPGLDRILFGGLTGTPSNSRDTARCAAAANASSRSCPTSGGIKLSRAWTGQCAGTFDFMPHVGKQTAFISRSATTLPASRSGPISVA